MNRNVILLGGIMLAALALLLVKRSPSNDSRHSENDPPGRAVAPAAAPTP
jgi:hypothetical protein